MAWTDAIKGMLYEEPKGSPTPAQVNATTGAGVAAMTNGQAGSPIAAVNGAMVEAIKKVTFGRNTAFTQLLTASEALADVIPDPVMRLRAAHKTTSAGRTGRQIGEAVDVHLADVDSEQRKFDSMIDGKIATEVGAIEQNAAQAQRQVERTQTEIQQLSQRIADLQASIGKLAETASSAQLAVVQKRNELETAKHDFKLAADAVRNELNNSKAAILSTLV